MTHHVYFFCRRRRGDTPQEAVAALISELRAATAATVRERSEWENHWASFDVTPVGDRQPSLTVTLHLTGPAFELMVADVGRRPGGERIAGITAMAEVIMTSTQDNRPFDALFAILTGSWQAVPYDETSGLHLEAAGDSLLDIARELFGRPDEPSG